MKNPKKQAFDLAQKMRQFKDKIDRDNSREAKEVFKNADWGSFNSLCNQLEFTYNTPEREK